MKKILTSTSRLQQTLFRLALPVFLALLMFFGTVFAIEIESGNDFVFESVYEPYGVEFQGVLTGEPRFNSGVNYFDVAGVTSIVSPAYQLRVASPQTFPLKLEGFAWNDPWGWVSFKCKDDGFGYNNSGQACTGDYQTEIEMPAYNIGTPLGRFTGQGWNPNIGEIDFSWSCPSGHMPCLIAEASIFRSNRVKINFNTGQVLGYAWNDNVGWLYFKGTIDPIPTLSGFACGNGTTEGLEECDDGNPVNDDACTNACLDNVCGDGIASAVIGEQCDDGNIVPGDGCNATCQLESPAPSFCGDGIVNPGEACDEGIIYDSPLDINDDGECVIDSTVWECKVNVCGDGYLWSSLGGGPEQCDDGNLLSGDGCDQYCLIEPPIAICGDGVLQPNGADGVPGTSDDEVCDQGSANRWDARCLPTCQQAACGDTYLYVTSEQCDDGNTINGDLCDSTCKREIGLTPLCGDGIMTAPEKCDDGNLLPGDGCDAVCNLEAAVCGDGYLNAFTEQCDDGNLFSGDGCDSLCNDEVPGAICGNSIQEPNSSYGGNEECDDGNTSSGDGCSQECKVELAFCGDGIVNGSEACDDGNSVDTDICQNDCTFGAYAICGDGVLSFGESCDDGNTSSGDGCSFVCTDEVLSDPSDPASEVVPEEPTEEYVSINDCEDIVEYMSQMFNITLDSSLICNEYCGNTYLEEGEECDDGNTVGGDGCSETCTDEQAGAACGNYIEEIGEGCDDGNNDSGDGCSAFCEDEDQVIYLDDPTCEEAFEIFETILGIDVYAAGYCSTETYCGDENWDLDEECDWSDISYPSFADECNYWCEYVPVGWCGDAIQDPGEECDDGNYQDGDGCDAWCEYEFEPPSCGDGWWNLGEECEPGVTTLPAGTMCTNPGCELVEIGAVCGNGPVPPAAQEVGEDCDDGNNDSGDGCSSICEVEPTVSPITCFPFTDVVKTQDSNGLDLYEVFVQLNCLEEPLGTGAGQWSATIAPGGFDAFNTVDCDQITGTDPSCVFENPWNASIIDSSNPLVKIGEVYSYAPTGYVSALDSDNTYKLNNITVQVNQGPPPSLGPTGPIIFSEVIPVNYTMDFEPVVESKTLDASYGSELHVPYLNLGFEDPVAILSILQKNVSNNANDVSVDYSLSLGPNPPYVFKFDVNRDGDWNDSIDIYTLPRPKVGPMSTTTWNALNPGSPPAFYGDPSKWNYPAWITGLTDLGSPEGESLSMVINYKYPPNSGGKNVSYRADSIPDVEDFRVDGYGVQITGPVSSDKFLGGTTITQVGSIGEVVRRKDISRNIARLFRTEDISPSSTVYFDFDDSVPLASILSGGEYLDRLIEGQNLYYFKDDVVISHSGLLGITNEESRSIVVEGANVYIDDNIFNDDGVTLEIVSLKDSSGQGGNVFVGPDVTYLSANMVLDGSLFPYDGFSKGGVIPDFDYLEKGDYLDNQLTFEGSLLSNNTIGGADSSTPNYYKGDGSFTTDQSIAKIYDLDYFRRHGLVPGQTDSAGNPQDCDGDSTLEIIASFLEIATCSSGESVTSDLDPAGLRWSGRAADENYGMYFNYRPPANDSVIFGANSRVDSN